jgi:hypothetical protein
VWGVLEAFHSLILILPWLWLLYNNADSVINQDTETVAQKLQDESDGQIVTGVYHADKGDKEKDMLHQAWHLGRIKVVCATIGIHLLSFILIRADSFGGD